MDTQSLSARLMPSTKDLWKGFFDDSFFGKYMNKFWDTASPAINIADTGDDYSMEIAMPGFKKEDIKIDVAEDVLTVSAEARQESSEENKEYTRKEYNFSSFSHSFRLPDNVKDDAIEAEYRDGVLKLNLPKTNKQIKATKQVAVR